MSHHFFPLNDFEVFSPIKVDRAFLALFRHTLLILLLISCQSVSFTLGEFTALRDKISVLSVAAGEADIFRRRGEVKNCAALMSYSFPTDLLLTSLDGELF